MTVTKILAFLIIFTLGLVLIGAIIVWAAWYQLEVYIPSKNESNAATAHAWNEDYWENGHALRVTLTMDFSGPTGTIEVQGNLLCTAKYLVQTGGLKNSPKDYIQVYTTGPSVMSVPIDEGVLLRADIRNACKQAFVAFDSEFTDQLERLGLDLQIISDNPALTCIFGNRTGTILGSSLRKAYISNIDTVPVSTVLSKGDFEIIEASDLSNRLNISSDWYGQRNPLFWSGCWTSPRSEICNAEAEQICGSPNL